MIAICPECEQFMQWHPKKWRGYGTIDCATCQISVVVRKGELDWSDWPASLWHAIYRRMFLKTLVIENCESSESAA